MSRALGVFVFFGWLALAGPCPAAAARADDTRGPKCGAIEKEFKDYVGRRDYPGGMLVAGTQRIPTKGPDAWLLTCLLRSTAAVDEALIPEYLGTFLFRDKMPPLRIGPILEQEEDPALRYPEARYHPVSPPTRAYVSRANEIWLVQNSVLGGTETYRLFLLSDGYPVEKAVFSSAAGESVRVEYEFGLDDSGGFEVLEHHTRLGSVVHPRKKDGTSSRGFLLKDTRTEILAWDGKRFRKHGESSSKGGFSGSQTLYGMLDGKLYLSAAAPSEFVWLHDERVRVLGIEPTLDRGDLIEVDVGGRLQGFAASDDVRIDFPDTNVGN